jgi:excisionase family DNA binding protein
MLDIQNPNGECRMTDAEPQMLYTTEQTAKLLAVSYATVRNMIATGKIRIVRPSGQPRIPASELQRLCTPPSKPANS